jgi:ribosomal protein S18 acetylase RimI-like enzyme
MPSLPDLIPATEISCHQNVEAARLVFKSLPEYYLIFHNSEKEALAKLSDLLEQKNGEFEEGVALLNDERISGICFWISTKKLITAQLKSLMFLSTNATICNEQIPKPLKAYTAKIEPIESTTGTYLTSLAIATELLGSGAADRLIKIFLAEVKSGELALLHVDNRNKRAIKFYQKIGFNFSSSRSYTYRLMQLHTP